MLTDKEEYKEEGFLGDETFQSREQEIAHLCRIIQSTVARKVFTFQEALDAYEVTRDEYDYYQAKTFISEAKGVFDTLPEKENVLAYIKTATIFLSIRFKDSHYKGLDQDFDKAISVLKQLQLKVEREAAIHDLD